MRLLPPLAVGVAAAGLLLAGCGRDEAPPIPADQARMSIEQDNRDPPAAKGKLEVLPSRAASAEPAPAVRAPPPEPPAPPRSGRYDRWAEGPPPPLEEPEPTPRQCRRAARNGDPLADSPACQDLLAADEDEALIRDCMDADAAGDPFADSGQCRALRR